MEQYKWKEVVLVGEGFRDCAGSYHYFPDSEKARQWLKSHDFKGVQILVKGSRSMKMERVLD
jgi:UDP-N-acetylmuramoyl-tripeptide--D-alanyl-D-alanine ligase